MQESTPRIRSGCLSAFILALLVISPARPLAQAQTPVERAWSVLEAGLSNKKSEERAVAVRSLGLLQNDDKGQQLAINALGDHKAEVRIAAADALGQMQAKSSVSRLGEIIPGEQKHVRVVLACAHSMIQLGDKRGYAVYYAVLTGQKKKGGALRDVQKRMLQQLFQDPKKMAIGFLPFGGTAYSAYQNFHRDDDSPVRAAAAKELTKDPDTKTETALVNATSDKSWALRMSALESLAHRENPKVIAHIEQRLKDKKHGVRYTAAGAIIHLSSVEAAAVAKR